jgi:large subunit ribosomal protein L29
MKSKEINKLSKDELKNKINSLKKDLFNFRFRKVNGQMDDTAKVSTIKKDVAKLLTKLNKKELK